jgi:hypothetical protein
LTVTGTQWTETKTEKTEHQDILPTMVDGAIVRETTGKTIETNVTSLGYSGNGTGAVGIPSGFTGTNLITTSEFYSESFKEVITTDWSNQLNEDDELELTSSANAELTTDKVGSYGFYYYLDMTLEVASQVPDTVFTYVLYKSVYPVTVSIASAYSSTLSETWTRAEDEENFSLSGRSGTYEDSAEASHGYDYYCRHLLLPPGVTYTSGNIKSSSYDNYEIDIDEKDLSVSYDGDFDKYWTTTNTTIETNDYLSALIGEFIAANDLSDEVYAIVYGSVWGSGSDLNSMAYSAVQSLFSPESFNTNFTDNGKKTSYAATAPTPIDVEGIDPAQLEEPLTNDLEFEDLTTGKPNFGNAVKEMPEPTGEKPIPPPPPNPGSSVGPSYEDDPTTTWGYCWGIARAFVGGLQTGGKALVNGATSTIVSTVTIGQINNVELITVTDTDRAYGYDYSFAAAQVATTSVVALATMGAGCAAAQGSRIAGVAVSSIRTVEAANAVNNVVTGTGNMIANGSVDVGNAVQVGTGLLGMGALKASTCFTAGTQVVIDDKTRDEVYFTETSVTQSYDEINILFTLAGLSSAFVATTITLKKRKSNKPIPSIPKKVDQIDDGLLCEVDETKRTFSLQKWMIVPLLIIVTIICGYFALPTTRTVAITKSVEQVKEGYVTKNIEDIKVDDYVFTYDVTTGKVSKCKVTDTFKRTSDHLRYLTVNDSTGIQIFETTDSHPFWVLTDNPDISRVAHKTVEDNGAILHHENIAVTKHGYYIEAKDLKVGDVFMGVNGEVSVLASTKRVEFPEGITVYNFTVDGNHNYFVVAHTARAEQACILVHNAEKINYGYRVMNNEEYAGASKGIWADSDLVGKTPSEIGSKWLWSNRQAAQIWKNSCEINGETGQIITIVKIKEPISSYQSFSHPPEGTAYHVPISDLRKAKKSNY